MSRYTRRRQAYKHEPRLTGDMMTAEQYARLRARMVRNVETGCLVWQGAVDKDGYGVVVWRGKNYYASGAPEKEISAGATLGAIQKAVNESAFSFLREE